jgi:hypothetical protein
MATKLPWYSFLYRLLGAQGTFWLWIVAISALWWTEKPFIQRLENRTPVPVTPLVAGAGAEGRRWIDTAGVEVGLDRGLLLLDERKGPSVPPNYRLLLHPEDSATQWWVDALALANTAAEGQDPDKSTALRALRKRIADLEGQDGRDDALPSPKRALLVEYPADEPRPAPPAQPVTGPGMKTPFEEREQRIIDRIRANVRPSARIEGVLVETPPTLRERYKDDVGVVVAPFLVRQGAQPRDLESYVFGGAAICFLFLAAGFRGASRSSPPADEAGAEVGQTVTGTTTGA